jgi:hypothetical protein
MLKKVKQDESSSVVWSDLGNDVVNYILEYLPWTYNLESYKRRVELRVKRAQALYPSIHRKVVSLTKKKIDAQHLIRYIEYRKKKCREDDFRSRLISGYVFRRFIREIDSNLADPCVVTAMAYAEQVKLR